MNRWAITGLFVLLALAPAPAVGQQADWLIRGGSVYDGSGAPPRRADVAIRGDRIVLVGDGRSIRVSADHLIDGRGLVVSPGFIDPHTHFGEDLNRPDGAGLVPALMQGITTVVVGNDGGGPVDVAGTLDRWTETGMGVNVLLYVGFGSVRQAVLGAADRAPTAAELKRMEALVAEGMRGGAFGLSTGLFYAPQSYARTGEVVALARVAARAGGLYDSHLRDESSYTVGLLGAVREALEIGRRAGLPVHLSHLKALGVDVWGRSDSVVAMVERARKAGQRVTADQYPYTASGTSVEASLLPRWAEAGGRDSVLVRLADPRLADTLRREMTANLRRRGGAASLLLTSGHWTGKRLNEVAAAMGVDSIAAAQAVIREGGASVASFNMTEPDIERFMRQPWVVTGSDGSSGHPRKYGTFPRKLRVYALERGVLSFTDAIAASSARTAAFLGLADRGRIAPGLRADLVVFDSTALADRATYEHPRELAAGMRAVFVNGVAAVRDGRPTGAKAGRALRHASTDGR